MSRQKGSKNKHSRPKKQICVREHNVFLVGRNNCGQCRDRVKEDNREYYIKNRSKLIKKALDWVNNNPEKARAFHESDKRKKYMEKYNFQHVEVKKEWNRNHRAILRIRCSRSKGNRRLRVPVWGQDGILEFYQNCPKKMTVDHIIPLQGKKVSGLDVIWNLRYLTAKENSKKHNKCNLLEASNWYGKLLLS